jgi:polyphosphate kinase 2 (PPK2 family)
MKVRSTDFLVEEGHKVQLDKWPTAVEPIYQSKMQYQKILANHVDQLSSLQQLLYASNRYALRLIFQAMDAAGTDGAIKARDVWGESSRLSGFQLQTSQRDGIAA